MINFFYKLFGMKKFNHNPNDFKLIHESWGGEHMDCYYVKYSANGGLNWKYIYYANPPFLGNDLSFDWSWEKLWYKINHMSMKSLKEKFNSYQCVLDYEKEQREKYEKGLKSQEKRKKEYYNRINDLYKN